MKTRKKALVSIALVIALVPILVLTVSAETYTTTFSLMEADDLITGSTNVYPSNTNITEYTQKNTVLIDVSGDSQFVFGSEGWRQTVNVTKWTPIDTDVIYAGNWTWQAGFRIPDLPSADSRFLVFTVLGRMSSATYTQPIEDSHLIINGISLEPSKIVQNARGNYYTYVIDSFDVKNQMDGLQITFTFGDFEAPTSTSNIGYSVYLTYQFSEVTVYSTLSAAAQAAQAIENLIENDIAPTLDNIEDLMDQMTGQQAALNSNVTDLKDAVEDLPGQMGEEFDTALKDQGAAEHSFGLQEGDKQVQDALGALPMGDIDQAGSALERFANAISSDKRSSRFDIPEIYIPELKSASGEILMEKLTLIEPTSFYWEQVIDHFVPPVLLIVVRAVITLGLGIYIFMELFRFVGMFSAPGGEG